MNEGKFGSRGELFFEIDLLASDELIITVDAMLDTGFTDWLAINTQDALSLGWQLIDNSASRLTALGEAQFALYAGVVILDGEKLNIPVIVGEEIAEVLLGLPWLLERRLVVDVPENLLTLGKKKLSIARLSDHLNE